MENIRHSELLTGAELPIARSDLVDFQKMEKDIEFDEKIIKKRTDRERARVRADEDVVTAL